MNWPIPNIVSCTLLDSSDNFPSNYNTEISTDTYLICQYIKIVLMSTFLKKAGISSWTQNRLSELAPSLYGSRDAFDNVTAKKLRW